MDSNDIRISGILVKKNIDALYAELLPLYALAATWTLNALDADLPPENEVQAVLNRYAALSVPRNSAENSLKTVQRADIDAFDGPWPTRPPECVAGGDGLYIGLSGLVIDTNGLSIPGNAAELGLILTDSGLMIAEESGLILYT